jgi:hypothetical protein
MKKLLSGLGIALMLMITMTGCSDPEATAQLTDGIWNFSNMTTDSEDESIQLVVNGLKVLHTDATMEFQEGGEYIKNYLVGDPQTGTWTLIGDDQLILNPDGEDEITSTAKISELTANRLSYVVTVPDSELNTYKVTTTWTK